jgi:hypothetical protein
MLAKDRIGRHHCGDVLHFARTSSTIRPLALLRLNRAGLPNGAVILQNAVLRRNDFGQNPSKGRDERIAARFPDC